MVDIEERTERVEVPKSKRKDGCYLYVGTIEVHLSRAPTRGTVRCSLYPFIIGDLVFGL